MADGNQRRLNGQALSLHDSGNDNIVILIETCLNLTEMTQAEFGVSS